MDFFFSLLSENGLRKLQTLLSKTSFKRGKGHEVGYNYIYILIGISI